MNPDQITYTDRILDCADCGSTFTLTAGEREFYARKHLPEARRCKECRHKRREQARPVNDQHTARCTV
jgi:hypothetical protein